MEKFLSRAERHRLIRQHKSERDGRIRDRIKAVLLSDDGYTPTQIAKILLIDDETVNRHINDYLEFHKLSPSNGGSESHLSEKETAQLVAHLREITYLYVKDICAYVKSTYGVKYSISGMIQWLHAHGFRYKKAHAVPAKADLKKQERFIRSYRKLKKEAGNKEPIYFLDSCHPAHQTQLVQGWILKGVRKAIATTARQLRVNIIGGICLEGHRIVYQEADKVDTQSLKLFLDELRKRYPDGRRIHTILDRAGYHRSAELRLYARSLNIKLHYLPSYSPNLNPIERLWKIMHEQVTYNQYYPTFAQFKDAITDFLKTIGRKKTILRNRINDSFQTTMQPDFAS